ncbi:Predicted gene 5591 [Apodemus speciosus]|uniref:Predicted gene 5591 n=1 Tax=Apodemus speciosus TaxID=105296 RepID=A0ABQ0EYS6_APOSI
MSENFQSSPLFGTESALQSSLPVVSNSTHAGRVCNISRVSTPTVNLAWLLPPRTSTSLQLISGRAYLSPRAGTSMLVELTDESQNSPSALLYPGVLKWDLTESKDRGDALQELDMTIINQDTALSSLSVTAHGDKILDPHTIAPFYPTLLTSFVQVTPPQVPEQGYSLAPSYQDGSQVYCYNYTSPDRLIPEELRQCLQPCSSVSYPASEESVPQPEMEMAEKEILPRNLQIPISISDFSYSTSAQNMPDITLPAVDTETSLGLLPSGQTCCLLQSPELGSISSEVFQMRIPPDSGGRLLIAPMRSSSEEFLALPPAPSVERENDNTHEVKAGLSVPQDACEGTKENQDPSQPPLVYPDCTETRPLRQKSASDGASVGGISVGLEEREELENEMGCSINFEDITTLEAGNHVPQLFNTLKDIAWDPPLHNWRVMSSPSEKVRKNDLRASDLLDGAPQAKIQHRDLVGGEGAVCAAGASDRANETMAKHLEGKAPKAPPSKNRRVRRQGQGRPSGPENNSKKTEELKQSRNRVKAEEKPTVPKTKRKRNPPELSHNSFKKPRTHLGMHMLESVQVFHPLGKKSEKKTGISSFGGQRTSTSNKNPGPGPATPTLLNMPPEGQGPDRGPGKAQSAESSADKECPSPYEYELPPPGKVRLVPLPFPTLDKPQARPASRKPLPMASHRPATAYPVWLHSHSAHPSQPAPVSTSLMASAKAAPPISSSATQPNVANPIQSSAAPQLAYMRPAPCRAPLHTSFQRELVSAARNKVPSQPKPQTQHQPQDFSCQSIPWKKVDILGPVISQPITKAQRPEREAMKRRAQQERENAAKNSSPGKLQLFLQREEDMEISQYYGYAM